MSNLTELMIQLTKIKSFSKKIWVKKSEITCQRDDINCVVVHVALHGKSVCVPCWLGV